jgi:hypothetical protein
MECIEEQVEIRMALWKNTSTEPILLTELNSSSLRRTRLPGYNKKTNHFILQICIQYINNKQQLRRSNYVRTKFLKRRIYGYFYNNLRVNKTDKLTSEQLRDHYRNERIRKVTEYQELMTKHSWSKADLARHLGVSRAWVTIVMRELG